MHDTHLDEALPALGVRMRVAAWKRMVSIWGYACKGKARSKVACS